MIIDFSLKFANCVQREFASNVLCRGRFSNVEYGQDWGNGVLTWWVVWFVFSREKVIIGQGLGVNCSFLDHWIFQ